MSARIQGVDDDDACAHVPLPVVTMRRRNIERHREPTVLRWSKCMRCPQLHSPLCIAQHCWWEGVTFATRVGHSSDDFRGVIGSRQLSLWARFFMCMVAFDAP